jgi:predicted Zn-dependent protease
VQERIGGTVHVRSFASGTAYEAFFRAELALLRGEYELAARQLELATFADETDGWLLARRAEMIWLAGDSDAALQAARESVERFPHQAATWLVLGEVLTATQAYAQAAAAFTRALQEAPDDPETQAAVAIAQGATPSAAAIVRENASSARPADRTLAQRSLLDQGRDARPTLASVRRDRAQQAAHRGAWAEVDALLTPLVASLRATVQDRIALIEARVYDGRASTAVAIAASLRGAELSAAQYARLWLMVERPALAVELLEPEVARMPTHSEARYLLGLALDRTGFRDRALQQWSAIAVSDRHYADAQIAAAQTLERAAHRRWATRVLSAAIDQLTQHAEHAAHAQVRDQLRLEQWRLSHDFSAYLQAKQLEPQLETDWGRQQLALAYCEQFAPHPAMDLDAMSRALRLRTNTRVEDARADANLAILCATERIHCDVSEPGALLARAQRSAAQDTATLRAEAVLTAEPLVRLTKLRALSVRDPLNPLQRWLLERYTTQTR